MTKQDLIERIAAKTGLSCMDAKKFIDALDVTIAAELAKGGEVSLGNCGKFKVKSRVQRLGRNPKTGESITIPAKRVPAFSPAKALKDAIV